MLEVNFVCCVCVETKETLKSIIERDLDNIQILDKLGTCAASQTWQENWFICQICLVRLDDAYSFIRQCLKSDELRDKLIQESVIIKVENERWSCQYCNETFATRGSVKRHIGRKHTPKEKNPEKTPEKCPEQIIITKPARPEKKLPPFPCEKCNQTFSTAGSARRHVTRRHPPDPLTVSPNISNNETERKEEIYIKEENVIKEDVEEDQNLAVNINEGFDNEDTEVSDEIFFETPRRRRKSKYGPYKCIHCSKLYEREKDLAAHKNMNHRSDRPFHCSKCESTFLRKQSLIVHIKNRHTGAAKEHICATCGLKYKNQSMLTHHMKEKHLNEREFLCDICSKGFNTRTSLNGHQKVVHGDPSTWPNICHICNKRFPLSSGLENHIKRHMGIKDVICHVCSKGFIDNNDLKKHLISHSQNRTYYPCPKCKDKIFFSTDGLKKHMFIHHNVGNYKKPEKKFVCTVCSKSFTANSKLQKHTRTHTGERPFICEYCGKKFIDNSLRKSHILSQHQILLYKDDFGKEVSRKIIVKPREQMMEIDDPVISYDDKVVS